MTNKLVAFKLKDEAETLCKDKYYRDWTLERLQHVDHLIKQLDFLIGLYDKNKQGLGKEAEFNAFFLGLEKISTTLRQKHTQSKDENVEHPVVDNDEVEQQEITKALEDQMRADQMRAAFDALVASFEKEVSSEQLSQAESSQAESSQAESSQAESSQTDLSSASISSAVLINTKNLLKKPVRKDKSDSLEKQPATDKKPETEIYKLALMEELPEQQKQKSEKNKIYISSDGKYVVRNHVGFVYEGRLLCEYELALVSGLGVKENGENKVPEDGKIYLGSDGNYLVLDSSGVLRRGSLNGKKGAQIDLRDLANKLQEPELKKSILEITSSVGHTVLGADLNDLKNKLNNPQVRSYVLDVLSKAGHIIPEGQLIAMKNLSVQTAEKMQEMSENSVSVEEKRKLGIFNLENNIYKKENSEKAPLKSLNPTMNLLLSGIAAKQKKRTKANDKPPEALKALMDRDKGLSPTFRDEFLKENLLKQQKKEIEEQRQQLDHQREQQKHELELQLDQLLVKQQQDQQQQKEKRDALDQQKFLQEGYSTYRWRQLKNYENEINTGQSEIEKISLRVAELEAQSKQLTQQKQEKQRELQNQQLRLENDKATFEKDSRDEQLKLEEKQRSLDLQKNETGARIKEQQERLSDQQQELVHQMKQEEVQLVHEQQTLAYKKQQIGELIEEQKQLKEHVVEIEKQVEQKGLEITETKRAIEEKGRDNADKTKALDTLSLEYNQQLQVLNELNQQVIEKQDGIEGIGGKLAEIEIRRQQLSAQHERKASELADQLQLLKHEEEMFAKQQQELQHKLDDEQRYLSFQRGEIEQKKKALVQLQFEQKEYDQEIEKYGALVENNQHVLKNKHESLVELKNQSAEQKNEIDQLAGNIEQSRKEVEENLNHLGVKIKELKAQEQQKEEQKYRLENLELQLRELEGSKKELEGRTEELRQELEQAGFDLAENKEGNQALIKECKELNESNQMLAWEIIENKKALDAQNSVLKASQEIVAQQQKAMEQNRLELAGSLVTTNAIVGKIAGQSEQLKKQGELQATLLDDRKEQRQAAKDNNARINELKREIETQRKNASKAKKKNKQLKQQLHEEQRQFDREEQARKKKQQRKQDKLAAKRGRQEPQASEAFLPTPALTRIEQRDSNGMHDRQVPAAAIPAPAPGLPQPNANPARDNFQAAKDAINACNSIKNLRGLSAAIADVDFQAKAAALRLIDSGYPGDGIELTNDQFTALDVDVKNRLDALTTLKITAINTAINECQDPVKLKALLDGLVKQAVNEKETALKLFHPDYEKGDLDAAQLDAVAEVAKVKQTELAILQGITELAPKHRVRLLPIYQSNDNVVIKRELKNEQVLLLVGVDGSKLSYLAREPLNDDAINLIGNYIDKLTPNQLTTIKRAVVQKMTESHQLLPELPEGAVNNKEYEKVRRIYKAFYENIAIYAKNKADLIAFAKLKEAEEIISRMLDDASQANAKTGAGWLSEATARNDAWIETARAKFQDLMNEFSVVRQTTLSKYMVRSSGNGGISYNQAAWMQSVSASGAGSAKSAITISAGSYVKGRWDGVVIDAHGNIIADIDNAPEKIFRGHPIKPADSKEILIGEEESGKRIGIDGVTKEKFIEYRDYKLFVPEVSEAISDRTLLNRYLGKQYNISLTAAQLVELPAILDQASIAQFLHQHQISLGMFTSPEKVASNFMKYLPDAMERTQRVVLDNNQGGAGFFGGSKSITIPSREVLKDAAKILKVLLANSRSPLAVTNVNNKQLAIAIDALLKADPTLTVRVDFSDSKFKATAEQIAAVVKKGYRIDSLLSAEEMMDFAIKEPAPVAPNLSNHP